MAWVESLQKAIDYMEDHLLDNITIEDIAKQANVSAFHFQRIFAVLTDSSVGEYLRCRRLTLAVEELTGNDCKIIDLAYKYGYETPEAFTKAFRRQHGMTPSEMRKSGGMRVSYNRLIIQVNLKGDKPVKYKIVERDGFQAVGLRREFSYANGENLKKIPKLWEEANGNGTDQVLYKLNNGRIEGVLGVCVNNEQLQSEGVMEYWVAAEYDGDELPDGMERLHVPAARWAVFEVIGPMPDAMQKAWKQIYSEWIPSSGYALAGEIQLEVYGDGDPYGPDYDSEIWIPVK